MQFGDLGKKYNFLILIIAGLVGFTVYSTPLSASGPLVVAVLDTGVDLKHDLLQGHVWTNPHEVPGNGVDDDGNGYIDDVSGWNFADSSADLNDDDGHGTHIAGILLKESTRPVKVMVLKYYDKNQTAHDQRQAFLNALRYAVKMGAEIINVSGGGTVYSQEEYDLLAKASSRGISIVSAAGNKLPHETDRVFYPAAYDLPRVFSVVATDENGHVLSTSNQNKNKANYFAVGKNIRSTLPGGRYGRRTGSSQATALFTAGLVSGRVVEPSRVVAISSESLK